MGILRTDIVSHSQLEGSGSVELDGVGDYLTFASHSAFTAGTSDVTFELWVYLTDSTDLSNGNYYLFDMGSNGYRLQIYQGTLYFGDGSNTTSGSNGAHDENTSANLSANNNRRGKYTLTTDPVINNNNVSAKFTVANSTTTADDIVIMNCTSNHQIEVHTFNVTSSGWDFFFVNRSGSDITTDQPLEFNFIVMQ